MRSARGEGLGQVESSTDPTTRGTSAAQPGAVAATLASGSEASQPTTSTTAPAKSRAAQSATGPTTGIQQTVRAASATQSKGAKAGPTTRFESTDTRLTLPNEATTSGSVAAWHTSEEQTDERTYLPSFDKGPRSIRGRRERHVDLWPPSTFAAAASNQPEKSTRDATERTES